MFLVILVVQDGTIDKNDLRGAFDNVGVLMTESELDELLGEVKEYISPLNLRISQFLVEKLQIYIHTNANRKKPNS